MRRVRRHGNIGGPSPAIRPGLRCGDTIAPNYEGPAPPLPGHQAGAPLRRDDAPAAVAADCCPSPAIRPGLRCGVIPVLVRLAFCTSLPGHQAGAPLRRRPRAGDDQRRRSPSPAIRPGLRCGDRGHDRAASDAWDPPRPSGRGSVAATATALTASRSALALPGHQAGAPLRRRLRPRDRRRGHRRPSPAIRPGLRCGALM